MSYQVFKLINGKLVPTWEWLNPQAMEIGDCFKDNGFVLQVKEFKKINGFNMVVCEPIEVI